MINKSYRNMISPLLEQSKKNYYDKYFKDNVNNIKNIYKENYFKFSLQKTTKWITLIISLSHYGSANNSK